VVPCPHLDLPVTASGGEVPAVAAEHHPYDLPQVGAGRADPLAVFCVPSLYFSVLASRDQVSAVGAERQGHVLRPAPALREREAFASGLCAQALDGKQSTIPACGSDPLAVPDHAEGNRPEVGKLDGVQTGPRVPDLDA